MTEGSATVFIVDDDAGVLKALTRLVGAHGYQTQSFISPQEFLAHHPDAIGAETVRDAWAHSYIQRARRRCVISGEYAGAFRDVTRALRIRPTSRVAWKTLSAIALDASGLRRTSAMISSPSAKIVPLLSFVIPF